MFGPEEPDPVRYHGSVSRFGITLPPGGSLALTVTGLGDLDDPEIIATHDRGLSGRLVTASERTTEGLAAGPWTVTVRRRPWRRGAERVGGELYARGSVVVEPGETATLSLSARRGSVPPLVPVRMSASIPRAWQEVLGDKPKCGVYLVGVGPATIDRSHWANAALGSATDDGARRAIVALGGVRAGRYRLIVDARPASMLVDVPLVAEEVGLPDPAEVR